MASFNRYTCGAPLICGCSITKAAHKAWLLFWYTRQDSNLRPSESESDTLSS